MKYVGLVLLLIGSAVAVAFAQVTASTSSHKLDSTLLSSPRIVINEILADPPTGPAGDANQDGIAHTSQDEFIELVNVDPDGAAIDLSNWYVQDAFNGGTTRHVFPAGTILQSGCAIVIFAGGAPPPNNFHGAMVQTASTGTLSLNNSPGDSVTLYNSISQIEATITYGPEGGADVSLNLDPELNTAGSYTQHNLISGSNSVAFSPGSRVNGAAFGTCVATLPDTDDDGHPDATDNCPAIANPDQADCNGNMLGDACEIAFDPLLDCNNNNVLDECEPDCNRNGQVDACDISLGLSMDQNNNGIPDECEPRRLALNEIHADPHSTLGDANSDGMVHASHDEFLEFVNDSDLQLDLSNWRIFDGPVAPGTLRHHFPAGTVVPPMCSIVVFGGGTPTGAFGGSFVQTSSTGLLSLNNAQETVRVYDATFSLVLEVTFTADDGASITLMPQVTGESYVRHDHVVGSVGRFSPGVDVFGHTFKGCIEPTDDTDHDGISDALDNCPNLANVEQLDCDRDGEGDVCELVAGTQFDVNNNSLPDDCEIVAPTTGSVWISEIRIDQPGADLDEYFELTGEPGILLDGLTYVVIGDATGDGLGGGIEAIVRFSQTPSPIFIGPSGVTLVVHDTFSLGSLETADVVLSTVPDAMAFENGDDVTHLLVTNFRGWLGQDVDADDDGVIDSNAPWDVVVDAVSLVSSVNASERINLTYAVPLGFAFGEVGPADYGAGIVLPVHVWRCSVSSAQTASGGGWMVGALSPTSLESGDSPGVLNPPCPILVPVCPCDVVPVDGGDGQVTIADITAVLAAFGSAQPTGTGGDCSPVNGRLVGDGVVSIADVTAVLTSFGQCLEE